MQISHRIDEFDVPKEVAAASMHFNKTIHEPSVKRQLYGEDGCHINIGTLETEPQDRPDAGLLAREMLKKAKRRFLLKFWAGWVVFVALVFGILAGIWSVLPDYVTKGRYTVAATCSVPFGKGELTGSRTYNYAYKSLFGYHLVDESSVLERTEIDVTGDRFSVVGIREDGSWWRLDARNGERGTLILKEAKTYWIQSDKATAVVPYTVFCK